MSENSLSKRPLPAWLLRWRERGWRITGSIGWSTLALLGPQLLFVPLYPLLLAALPVSENTQNAIIQALLELVSAGFIFGLLTLYGRKWIDLGLTKWPTWQHGLKALGGFLVYFFISIIILVVSSQLFQYDQDQVQELGYTDLAGLEKIVAFAALVILTPIAEELIFRGFMFTGLRRRLPFWATALIVSGLFGLVHGQWNVGLDVFALSLVSCYLRETTQNLWPSILLHMLKNGVAFCLLYIYTIQ